jgi:PUA domain protein
LKNKQIRDIVNQITSIFKLNVSLNNASFEIGNLEQFKVILINGDIDLLILENKVFFTLRGVYKYNPKEYFVVVDMGAVGFVSKGADIMAPGIIDADLDIKKGDLVWICDEKHHKPLAIGKALMRGEDMKTKKAGKAIKNLHYVGDRLWYLSNKDA